MAIDVKNVGTFGISFSRDLDQTWVNLIRKDGGFLYAFYQNVYDEDEDENLFDEEDITLTTEEGEAIIRQAIEDGHLEEWQTQYGAGDDGPDSELVWTIDVDDLDEKDLLFISGNLKLPADKRMDAVIAAFRSTKDDFMRCFSEFR